MIFFRFDFLRICHVFILDFLRQSNGEGLNLDGWRNSLYFGRFQDGSFYKPHDKLLPILSIWQIYTLREYFVYALEALFSAFLRYLSVVGDSTLREFLIYCKENIDMQSAIEGLGIKPNKGSIDNISLKELYGNISSAIEKAEPIPEGHGKYSHFEGWELDFSEENLVNLIWGVRKGPAEKVITTALVLLITIYARLNGILHSYDHRYAHLNKGDRERLSIEYFFSSIEGFLNRDTILSEFIDWLYRECLIPQHIVVATEKIAAYGLDTFCFDINEHRFSFIKGDVPKFNVFRVMQAQTMLIDLSLIEEESSGRLRLTKLGEEKLEELLKFPGALEI